MKTKTRRINVDVFFALLVLLIQAEGTRADVSTSTPTLAVPENQGADLKCQYSSDFGTPRIEWKFINLKGTTAYVIYANKPTDTYAKRVVQYNDGLRFNKVTREDTGEYICEVSNNGKFGNAKINMIVQVPPSIPVCRIPTSVTTGSVVRLTCKDLDGSPPSTYRWMKDKTPLPEDPSKFASFKNYSYTLNPKEGTLDFAQVSKADAGDYYCAASNGFGTTQSCAPVTMAVKDLNTGGIVAGVIVALLAVGILCFGLWYARRKGYFAKKYKRSNVAFNQPETSYADEEDGEFRQKSSFVV